ncbi:unnamed protein product [Camellia sinensis]
MTTPNQTSSPGSSGLRSRENLYQLPLEVESNDILIIVGETGSGKTTRKVVKRNNKVREPQVYPGSAFEELPNEATRLGRSCE